MPQNARSDQNHRQDQPTTVSGDDARQGQIVLNTPARRWIFIVGLVGFVVLAFLLAILS
ncbi:hypothetical protein IGS68_31565 (plasmid) [Skermanella sp. TT6]|uniref:Uncharacterized protein n=1 Tax=Skermanella cutis TaxID=2775420 RepID=A0ABX7BI56_9PROT|nr:hypothetical protein [Skermanella sp. TT6]QQP92973.1 hypothetical protein IGS68_31565 [Skermanella sp. TT6]